jgi:hypothetical protein
MSAGYFLSGLFSRQETQEGTGRNLGGFIGDHVNPIAALRKEFHQVLFVKEVAAGR